MDSATATFFRQLKTDPANNKCFDCASTNPQWASVNNGVFLCLVCCGIHRSLGVNISFVRSLSMDTWTDQQKQMMQCGGNAAALVFFEQQKIEILPTRTKYNTVAAEYYRKMLKAKATETEFTDPLPVDGAAPLNPPPAQSAPAAPDQFGPKADQGGYGAFSFLSGGTSSWADMGLSALGTIATKAQEAAGTAMNTVQEKGVLEVMSEAASVSATWVGEKSRTVVSTVQTEDFWKNAQQTVSSVAGTATETIGSGVVIASEWVNQKLDNNNSSFPNSPADVPTQSQSASSINPQTSFVATPLDGKAASAENVKSL